MTSKLIHPSLMAHVAKTHFNSTVIIGHSQITVDAANEPTITYIPDTSLGTIDAYIEPVSNNAEVRKKDQTVVTKAYTIMLAGYYPTISDDDQVMDNQGRAFNILSAGTDDTNTLTVLICERVNPSVDENA